MATTRKTAAQKAAEAAERDEYTGKTPDSNISTATIGEELPETVAPAEVKPKKETVQQLKNRLRNEAEREVLNKHKGEVVKITEAKYDAHGLEYVRRLSEEEKAAKQIEDLYEKFPQLRPVVEEPAEEATTADQSLVAAGGWAAVGGYEGFTEESAYNHGE